MHAAQVQAWGEAPKWVEVPDLPPPTPSQIRLKVLATGIHRVVRAVANGATYGNSRPLPIIPGIDGVGVEEATGKHYYFTAWQSGSVAKHVNVERSAAIELPSGADVATIAALVNPAISSWMALTRRAGAGTPALPAGFSVLVVGATSISGRLAAPVARHFGAGRIIGAAKNKAALDGVEGLDERIVLDDADATTFAPLGHVDVVLDYAGGPYPAMVITALKPQREVIYIQIGIVSGDDDFHVPAILLRTRQVSIRGSGPGAWDAADLAKETEPLLHALRGVRANDTFHVAKMSDIEKLWNDKSLGYKRLVFTP